MNRDVCEHFTPVDLPCEKCKSASVQKSTQPEALRLADALDAYCTPQDVSDKAAAELRRLHEAHDWQYKMAGERLRRIEKLERQRDALLEALKEIVDAADGTGWDQLDASFKKARAAITKAEEKA